MSQKYYIFTQKVRSAIRFEHFQAPFRQWNRQIGDLAPLYTYKDICNAAMAHSKEPDAHVVLALAHISQQPVSTEHQNRPHSDLNSSENKLEKISWNHWRKKLFHFTKKWLNFTVACGNSGNWSSHFFDKYSVKTTFLLKSWFHEIFFGEKVFVVFPRCEMLNLVIFYVKWNFNEVEKEKPNFLAIWQSQIFWFGEFGTFSVSKKV